MGERVMVVDGNSLLHRSFHALAWTGARGDGNEPVWAVRGLLTQLVAAAERLEPAIVVVGFDDPDLSHRRERWPTYKAQRAEKLPTLVSQLRLAGTVLEQLGIHVVVPTGWEADDVLASTARWVAAEGGHTVLVTSDRDAFALINDRTSVLRMISGGVEGSPLLTPDRLELLVGVCPEQYPDFAALRGDPSDNLPGVDGIGPKRAARLLQTFGTATQMFSRVDSDPKQVSAVVGPAALARLATDDARQRWQHNLRVMAPQAELDVGLGVAHGPGRLPLVADDVHRSILGYGLPGTAALARRVLGKVVIPDETTTSAVDDLGWDSRGEWRGRRSVPRLPVSRQPTLF